MIDFDLGFGMELNEVCSAAFLLHSDFRKPDL